MPIVATVPVFPLPTAPTTAYPQAQNVQALQLAMTSACAPGGTDPESIAACTAAYNAWRAADDAWRLLQAQLGLTTLPAYIPTSGGAPTGGMLQGPGAGVLPPTPPSGPSLSGPPGSVAQVPLGRRPPKTRPRPPRPHRVPRPPRCSTKATEQELDAYKERYKAWVDRDAATGGAGGMRPRDPASNCNQRGRTPRPPRKPRLPRKPRPKARKPKVEDSGYRFYCMTSNAEGYNCSGSQCVNHHYKVVEAQRAIHSHLSYQLTLTCDPCGGQGCQLGGFISCSKLPWRVPARETEAAVGKNIRDAERRARRPWWERRRIAMIIAANPQLTPREALRLTPRVDPLNCWCLPPPWFLYPPNRGRCFPAGDTPASMALGNMWITNPTGANCGALLEGLGYSKPVSGW